MMPGRAKRMGRQTRRKRTEPRWFLIMIMAVDDGQMEAKKAIEEIEHLTGKGEGGQWITATHLRSPHYCFDPPP